MTVKDLIQKYKAELAYIKDDPKYNPETPTVGTVWCEQILKDLGKVRPKRVKPMKAKELKKCIKRLRKLDPEEELAFTVDDALSIWETLLDLQERLEELEEDDHYSYQEN